MKKSEADDTKQGTDQTTLDTVSELRGFFKALAAADGLSERGAHLALLYLEKAARHPENGMRWQINISYNGRLTTSRLVSGTKSTEDFVALLCQYFEKFSDKTCCFEDLKPYVSDLTTDSDPVSEEERWLSYLRAEADAGKTINLKGLQRLINRLKLLRYSILNHKTELEESEDASVYMKHYFENLTLGKSLPHNYYTPTYHF